MTRTADLSDVSLGLGQGPFTASPTWTSLKSENRLQRWTATSPGRGTPIGPFDAGSAEVVIDNSDGAYDFFNVTTVRPNIPAKIEVVANGNTRRRFTGLVDSATPAYGYPKVGMLTLNLTTGYKFLARDTTLGLGLVPREPTSVRVDRILDAIGWPTGASWRDIQNGSVMMSPRDLDEAGAIEELNRCVRTEGFTAAWFIDTEGRVVFENRSSPASTKMTTVSGGDGLSNEPLADALFGFQYYDNVTEALTDRGMFNRATVKNTNGVTATYEDAASVAAYGPLKFPTREMDTDHPHLPQSEAMALVNAFKDLHPATSTVSRGWVTDDIRFDNAMQWQLRKRLFIYTTTVDGGTAHTALVNIERMTDTCQVGDFYRTSYTVSDGGRWDALGAGNWFIIGSSLIGGTDVLAP